MVSPKLYFAEVIDNNDSLLPDKIKLGRIQVRLIPEMEQVVNQQDLPWVRPLMVNPVKSFCPPEVGDRVLVLALDDYFQVMFYLSPIFFDSLVDQIATYTKVGTTRGEYPDLKVVEYPDGSCVFRNSKTGDIGIVHKSGTEVTIDTEGKLTAKNATTSLKTQLESIKSVLDHIVEAGAFIGNLGSPVLYKYATPDTQTLSDLTTNIGNLFKE